MRDADRHHLHLPPTTQLFLSQRYLYGEPQLRGVMTMAYVSLVVVHNRLSSTYLSYRSYHPMLGTRRPSPWHYADLGVIRPSTSIVFRI